VKDLLTAEEVAQYLRVTKKTVYRLLKQGKIPATKVAYQWRFDRNSIDEWLRRKAVGGVACILVIDDEDIVRALFREVLAEIGHMVLTAKDGAEGLELVKREEVDLVFLDLKMPGMNGVEVFREIKTKKPTLPVVIITGYPDSDMMVQALAQGPFAIMNKPFSCRDILEAVNSFLGTDSQGFKGRAQMRPNNSSMSNRSRKLGTR